MPIGNEYNLAYMRMRMFKEHEVLGVTIGVLLAASNGRSAGANAEVGRSRTRALDMTSC